MEALIQELPKFRLKAVPTDCSECPICLEEFHVGNEVIVSLSLALSLDKYAVFMRSLSHSIHNISSIPYQSCQIRSWFSNSIVGMIHYECIMKEALWKEHYSKQNVYINVNHFLFKLYGIDCWAFFCHLAVCGAIWSDNVTKKVL